MVFELAVGFKKSVVGEKTEFARAR